MAPFSSCVRFGAGTRRNARTVNNARVFVVVVVAGVRFCACAPRRCRRIAATWHESGRPAATHAVTRALILVARRAWGPVWFAAGPHHAWGRRCGGHVPSELVDVVGNVWVTAGTTWRLPGKLCCSTGVPYPLYGMAGLHVTEKQASRDIENDNSMKQVDGTGTRPQVLCSG